jgi:hypothetical protein
MEQKTENNKIEEQVLTAIESGRVKMRPRWQFVLQAALLGIGAVMLLFVLLYLVSFILFVLHQNGAWFVPNFGAPGWFALFRRLPWVLIGLSAIFIIILEVLVRRYSFAYRRPLLASALGIVGVVLIGGVVIAATPFHARLFDSARHNGLSVIGSMYRGFGMPDFDDIHRGNIVQAVIGGFVIQDDDGNTSTVLITPQTRLPLGDDFEVGDTVIVFGTEAQPGLVTAFGIQKISE